MLQTGIQAISEVIKKQHCCDMAVHIQSVFVREVFDKRILWHGEVEVFEVAGRTPAKRCYAWSVHDGATASITTVLHLPPVDSPETAVKLAIAARARRQRQP